MAWLVPAKYNLPLTNEFIALALNFAHGEIVSKKQASTRCYLLIQLLLTTVYGCSFATSSSVTFATVHSTDQ